ncbi:type III pantothenate kinase [Pseudonocardia eucalypti]|uniref:Type III pantothenate kinase n=1 Tax=Pseudonocardia eucalypti TaxID=648755 RepID=A0ABP9R1S7_9PSEU|nr:type III pantothenate kinase [Pseudonocardia eucalypti]
MLLCVDIGNTQVSLGLYEDSDSEETPRPPLLRQWRMRTDPRMTADELQVAITGMVGSHADEITGVAALSTVPPLLRELRQLADGMRERVHSVIVGPRVRTGVPILVDNPKEVGADRVVNTLAAHRLFGTPAIVVDFGTSTNIDVVSPKGELLGAAIAPGIEISADALAARAAALTNVELVRPRAAIGKNTVECLQAGILFGFTGQVDGLVRRIKVELETEYKVDPATVTVIATGGLASLVVAESETITEHVDDLTLLGLRLVYLRNMRTVTVRSGMSNSSPSSGRPAR